jgi:deoxyribodipyrimidine photo-lyase
MSGSSVPSLRRWLANRRPVRPQGEFVLYWMTAQRRPRWNFALDRAIERAREFGRPLVVLEALRCDYPWASHRLHAFVLQGMVANRRAFRGTPVAYRAYVEPRRGGGRGMLAELSRRACAIVTDEFPCFFLPRMLEAAASQVEVELEVVDGNGLLPLRAAPRAFDRAVDFRRFLQGHLPEHLGAPPMADALRGEVEGLPFFPGFGEDFERRWPDRLDDFADAADAADAANASDPASWSLALRDLPIDAAVGPIDVAGGFEAASVRLAEFVDRQLGTYGERRNDPAERATSRLSPWLHFGHLSAHEVFAAIAESARWNPSRIGFERRGAREGWWGFAPAIEGFLDQLVTWRELGYGFGFHRPTSYATWESLPDWSRQTLEAHGGDPREWIYDAEQFESAATHDALWNAAQTQLIREGVIHTYLRMLWAKKVLEWSPDPRTAFELLIHLNNKYSIDGRNPNSYSGVAWSFGRFDRPWAPRRPIFGTVRFMSSANTARKFDLAEYLRRYAPAGGGEGQRGLFDGA